jgi:hypothetical protein
MGFLELPKIWLRLQDHAIYLYGCMKNLVQLIGNILSILVIYIKIIR